MPYRKRIAFLSEHASPVALLGGEDAGGQNVYVDEVTRNLARRGYLVDVFTRRDDPETPEIREWRPGVRVIAVTAGPERAILKDEMWPHMPAFRDEIERFAAREGLRYDVLHGNFWMSGWVGVELARRLDVPMVQIFHALGRTKRRHQGADDTSPPERIAVEMGIVRAADRVIAQCPAEVRELTEDYDADPERLCVIPSAVNTTMFRPVERATARRHIGVPHDGFVAVYVGRLLPRKDVRNIVRAIGEIERRRASGGDALPEISLVVVGGETTDPDPRITPELGELQRLAHELGCAGRVRLVGKRGRDDLRYYYGAGNVAVTTPWYEPFGLTPLEAMACGRPVIGSAVGGLTYTIADGVTGVLVPPRDPSALAARLIELARHPALGERMGRAARARVEREFTWERVAERTDQLYRAVMEEHRAAPWRVLPAHTLPSDLSMTGEQLGA
jgi:D-inositol-3-phosphate glycosyltransferase